MNAVEASKADRSGRASYFSRFFFFFVIMARLKEASASLAAFRAPLGGPLGFPDGNARLLPGCFRMPSLGSRFLGKSPCALRDVRELELFGA